MSGNPPSNGFVGWGAEKGLDFMVLGKSLEDFKQRSDKMWLMLKTILLAAAQRMGCGPRGTGRVAERLAREAAIGVYS